LGTIEYMAPEQVEGREADARSDIWAFGCLLYEMLTRVRPFQGATPASTVAAILEREPLPPPDSAGSIPTRIWDAIATCLQKNPEDRWQSARDLARELSRCAKASKDPTAAAAVPAPPAPSRRSWIALAAAALMAVAVPTGWLATRTASDRGAA